MPGERLPNKGKASPPLGNVNTSWDPGTKEETLAGNVFVNNLRFGIRYTCDVVEVGKMFFFTQGFSSHTDIQVNGFSTGNPFYTTPPSFARVFLHAMVHAQS